METRVHLVAGWPTTDAEVDAGRCTTVIRCRAFSVLFARAPLER
jgi:hypothetical protein